MSSSSSSSSSSPLSFACVVKTELKEKGRDCSLVFDLARGVVSWHAPPPPPPQQQQRALELVAACNRGSLPGGGAGGSAAPAFLIKVEFRDAPGKPVFFLFNQDEPRDRCFAMFKERMGGAQPPALALTTATTLSAAPNHGGNNNNNSKLRLPSPRKPLPPTTTTTKTGMDEDTIFKRIETLKKNTELQELHQTLRHGLNEDDFWEGREHLLEMPLAKQKLGVNSSSVADISEDSAASSQQVVEIKLDKEQIRRIFLEHPDVLLKYKEQVPSRMTESVFWTAYMHSKYVLGTKRDLGVDAASSRAREKSKRAAKEKETKSVAARMFGDVDEYRLKSVEERKSEILKQAVHVDRQIDLRLTQGDSLTFSAVSGLRPDSGYGLASRDAFSDKRAASSAAEIVRSFRVSKKEVDKDRIGEAVKHDPLLSTINRRAELTLRGVDAEELVQRNVAPALFESLGDAKVTPEPIPPPPVIEEKERAESEELRKRRIRQAFESSILLDHDLQPAEKKPRIRLNITYPGELGEERSKKTPFPPSAPASTSTSTSSVVPLASALPSVDSNRNAFVLVLSAAESDQLVFDAFHRMGEHFPDLKAAFVSELAYVDEFCRHYWASASGTRRASQEEKDRRCRIVTMRLNECQKRINETLRQAFREAVPNAGALLKLPLAQLHASIAHHVQSDQCTKANHIV